MGRRTRGILLIVLGLLLTFTGAGLYAKYEFRAAEAATNAQELLEAVETEMAQRKLTSVVLEAPKDQMVQTAVDGRGIIGILRIEEAGIRLPVLEQWNYENLEYGPCRYSGTLAENNLVLLGHNYQGHLADLDLVEEGDLVEFCDVTDRCFRFRVASADTIAPTAVEAVTGGDYPLTIFTCTPGGQSRYVVYCTEEAEP